ncbi:hypothetical protein D9M71_658120 [compost metagenome]
MGDHLRVHVDDREIDAFPRLVGQLLEIGAHHPGEVPCCQDVAREPVDKWAEVITAAGMVQVALCDQGSQECQQAALGGLEAAAEFCQGQSIGRFCQNLKETKNPGN